MAPVSSTSRVTSARKPVTRGAVTRLKKGAGQVVKEGGQWVKKAGRVLREDGTQLARGAGKAFKKGRQVILACAGAASDLVNR
jgi:hypothetical protein